jgi:hypothetical protein
MRMHGGSIITNELWVGYHDGQISARIQGLDILIMSAPSESHRGSCVDLRDWLCWLHMVYGKGDVSRGDLCITVGANWLIVSPFIKTTACETVEIHSLAPCCRRLLFWLIGLALRCSGLSGSLENRAIAGTSRFPKRSHPRDEVDGLHDESYMIRSCTMTVSQWTSDGRVWSRLPPSNNAMLVPIFPAIPLSHRFQS